MHHDLKSTPNPEDQVIIDWRQRVVMLWLWCLVAVLGLGAPVESGARTMRFKAVSTQEARQWQRAAREQLYHLMMGGRCPEVVPPDPRLVQTRTDPAGGFQLRELTVQTLPDRRVHAWLAMPLGGNRKVGGVLALHGHGGTGEQVVLGQNLYWYGRALAEMGYAVIAPDIGSHELQHTNWSLMGERTWDALRCLDYLATLPEVDSNRLAVAGLSLGGETAMYVGALDERVRAVCSSGWLTTTANMRQGHCPCWNFPGLEASFDFSDIFACVAPRPLVLEIGQQERAPGGFPVEVAQAAHAELRTAYRVLGEEDHLVLDLHPGGHVFRGAAFWLPAQSALGRAWPYGRATAREEGKGMGTDEGLRRGEIARRCLARAQRVCDAWWALRDPATGLFPRRIDQPVWAPQDNAADMLPFLFTTANALAPGRQEELMQAFRSEKARTCRLGPLPDWYALTNGAFLYPEPQLARILFGAAEYCKDGLVPMTEYLGRGPWTERMVELMDGIFERAPVVTDFGMLPADDTEVNGDVLQALARLQGITGDRKYLQWAARIVDAYCREVLPGAGSLPPHRWNFQEHVAMNDVLNLNDHGNEIVGGLAEWYVLARHLDAARAASWREPLSKMFHRLLDVARNEDGFWYNRVKPSTGEVVGRDTPDTWGYALAATLAFGTAAGDRELVGAVRKALQHLDRPAYLDWQGADSYADSLEGGLLLLNRVPSSTGQAWLEQMLPLFLGKQGENGIVEGWYGDGNYARTALMAALYFTQGTLCRPWRADLRWGAIREGADLRVVIQADTDWSGRLCFDTPRHRLNMGLPVNYPRLNEFPEWFTVYPERAYRLRSSQGSGRHFGKELQRGVELTVRAGQIVVVELRP